MLGSPTRIPKVVSVRVKSAEGLKIIPKSDHKQKKLTSKWKVHFVGGKKKMSTSSVLEPYGNPQWEYEVTFKLASRSDPVVLLVTDSEDHHVGQVVIPLVAIPPRPLNAVERPTDNNRLRRADLEPTKKVASPHGTLYYWIWVEEYRCDESDAKSSRGSMLSISSSKHKRASSVADSLNYSGSVISVGSTQGDKKEKKHHLFKKRHGKDLLASAAAMSTRRLSGMPTHDPSLSRSMGSVFDPTNRGSLLPPPNEYSHEDQDGSILGAGSDMTGSEFYTSALTVRSNNQQSQRLTPVDRNGFDSKPRGDVTIAVPPSRSNLITPELPRRISPLQEEPVEQERVQTMQPARTHQTTTPDSSSEARPQLLRLSPNSCPTTGGVEVTVYCSGLTDEMMRYASVLVDGYTVPRQDWFLQETSRAGQSELRIHMPERPTGRCFIELETMHHGRVRCPQEFTYTAPVPKESNSPRDIPDPVQRPLSRMGSQRSSLLVRDRRSVRGNRPPPAQTPSTEAEEQTEKSRSSAVRPPASATIPPTTTTTTTTVSSSVAADSTAPTPFIRRGSNRDSLSIVDRRSSRRKNMSNMPVLPNKEPMVLVQSNENETNPTATHDEYTVHFSPGVSPYDPTGGSSPFSRTGSQRSSLRVSDRRSFRLRNREQLPQTTVQMDEMRSTTPKPNNELIEPPRSEKLTVNIPTPDLDPDGTIPDILLGKQLTPVFEDMETPNDSPMVIDSDQSVGRRPGKSTLSPEMETLFPMNRSKRLIGANSDLNGKEDSTSVKKPACTPDSFILDEMIYMAEEPNQMSQLREVQNIEPLGELSNKTATQLTYVPLPAVSKLSLTSSRSPTVEHRDFLDLTPTNMDREPYVWEEDSQRSRSPTTVNQMNALTSIDAFPRYTGSPSGSVINGDRVVDPRSSIKSGSVLSSNSLEGGPKPIASKSPSLIRASQSHGSDMLSRSGSSHSENAELLSDDEEGEVEEMEEEEVDDEECASIGEKEFEDSPKQVYRGTQSHSYNYNPRDNSALDEDEEEEQEKEEEVNQKTDSQAPPAKSGFAQPLSQQDSGVESMKENASPFIRTGSQRSSIRVQDRRSFRRRPPSLLPDAPAIPTQKPQKQPDSPPLSDESPMERYEASGEAGSESNLSADQSPMDQFPGYSARRRNSHRSEASGQSRSMLDEHSKLETETLRSMLSEANLLIESMKKQTLELEKQLSEKSADVDRLSLELCKLRLRLLEGGATQFLEKCF